MKFCNHDEKPLEKVEAVDGVAFKGFTAFTTGCLRPFFGRKKRMASTALT